MLKKLLMLCVALALSLSAGFAAAVEVNSADQAALESVKGIGPVHAKAIIDERTKNGPFKDADDLATRVKGIGTKSVTNLEAAGLTINGSSAPPSGAKPAAKSEQHREHQGGAGSRARGDHRGAGHDRTHDAGRARRSVGHESVEVEEEEQGRGLRSGSGFRTGAQRPPTRPAPKLRRRKRRRARPLRPRQPPAHKQTHKQTHQRRTTGRATASRSFIDTRMSRRAMPISKRRPPAFPPRRATARRFHPPARQARVGIQERPS